MRKLTQSKAALLAGLTGLSLILPFGHVRAGTAAQMQPKAVWDVQPTAPKGAPNVIMILLDDVGFGASATFGGAVATPEFDKLAADGLRFNRFHTTSVCSPTRAALLTGRNQHRVNAGVASGNEQNQQGYSGIWPRSTASVADVLRRNGYSTAAFGKWHNTPNWEASPAGPFDRWPTGLGFEYFYGFLAGEASQWRPILYRNTVAAPPPEKPGYHFTTDIADDAIGWVHTHQALAPAKPYFLYFAPGGTHAPHQVPREWIDKYRGRFDQGWDKLREEIFARQKRLGVVPADAVLTKRPAELAAWDSLSADEKTLFARQMEVYAAFLEHTDHEIGRMVEAARKGPGGDNLLVMYIMGDNGASSEGGMQGSDRNIPDIFYGLGAGSISEQLSRMDALGGPKADNHFAIPWAWATNTPFQWTKQIASHLGGTRNPLVIEWRGHLATPGAVRSDWTHVIDVAPTLYDLIGIKPPQTVDGTPQKSIDGISFAYAIAGKGAPPAHRTQYFEMFGNRALYKDGWLASARHSLPWQLTNRNPSLEGDRWELYDLDHDFSQAKDVAASHPAILAELKAKFDEEARRNDVLPMFANIAMGGDRPSLTTGRTRFVYHADTAPVPSLAGAPILLGAHRIDADVILTDGAADGVILSNGAAEGGFTLYLKQGRLYYENNFGGRRWDLIGTSRTIPAGAHKISVTLTSNEKQKVATLMVDGQAMASGIIPSISPPSYLGALCVGRNCGTPVGQGYDGAFPLRGTARSVEIAKLD